ncbi:Serine protease precursor MucD/AlgY associated with sigma factor RpoE [Rubrivivax sp. A210]|uniref:S1 family peptidase n=1 Tax=Rubrivivax sp. A210 TaxID=2772301 RepID=UPI00191A9379|nr:serine protease [Rubrivivax sp. A210]CAD5375188.1 Serine protease precursor MucD/AlgY associated with sigma factor RpoE [Rubrivivax sp. A210]
MNRRLSLALAAGATALLLAGLPARAEDLVAVIKAARPSVLPVGTYNATDAPRFGFRGTGFVVGAGNWLVTNFHVLPPAAEVESSQSLMVMASREAGAGQLRRARLIAADRVRDLVLLELEGPPLPALALDEAGAVREGQAVALMGFPIGGVLGFAAVTHRGIVASITTAALPAPSAQQLDARAVSRLREGNFEVLQLDATAYPGNSGGPLLDASSGRVVGIVNQVLVKGSRESALTHPTGITYAIPVRYLHELLAEAARNRK